MTIDPANGNAGSSKNLFFFCEESLLISGQISLLAAVLNVTRIELRTLDMVSRC